MIQSNSHSIAKFKWHTSFDDKNLANDLQKNLSYLTNYKLNAIIEKVFAGICPMNQVWKIDTLEVDLGEILYADMDNDLPFKLRNKLDNRLNRLISYASLEDISIEVVSLNMSRRQLLIDIFTNGYLSAHTAIKIKELSDVLSFYIKNDSTNLEKLIQRLCSKAVSRKRLALQLNFKDLKHIVAISEPNHESTIVAFAYELVQLNNMHTLFDKDALKFESNLWVFIFNYLFQDKRILFDKSAFIERCINQCLDYYRLTLNTLEFKIKNSVWNGQIESLNFNLLSSKNLGFKNANSNKSAVIKENLKNCVVLKYAQQLQANNKDVVNGEILEKVHKSFDDETDLQNDAISQETKQLQIKNNDITSSVSLENVKQSLLNKSNKEHDAVFIDDEKLQLNNNDISNSEISKNIQQSLLNNTNLENDATSEYTEQLQLNNNAIENSITLKHVQQLHGNEEDAENHGVSQYAQQSQRNNETILKDYWHALEQILKNKNPKTTNLSTSDLDDLFKNLSKHYPRQFAKLLLATTPSKKHISRLLDDLTLTTLKSICVALAIQQREEVLSILDIIISKSFEIQLIENQKPVFKHAIVFLLNRKSTSSYNVTKLLAYTVKKIAKSTHKDAISILKRLLTETNENLPFDNKKVIRVQSSIKDLFDHEISSQNSQYQKIEIFKLLEQLSYSINEDFYQTAKSVHLQNILIKWMQLYPDQILRVFREFKNKAQLYRLLPHIMSHHSMDFFLYDNTKELHVITRKITRQFIKQNSLFSKTELLLLEDVLLKSALQLLIENNTSNQKSLIKGIIEKLINEAPYHLKSKLIEIMRNLAFQSVNPFEDFEVYINELEENFEDNYQEYTSVNIIKDVNNKIINKIELSKLLTHIFNSNSDIHKDLKVRENRDILLNYLIKDAILVLEVYQQKYIEHFRENKDANTYLDIKKSIESIFWKCAIDYTIHAQKNINFKHFLESSLYYHFGWTINKGLKNNHATKYYKNERRTLKLEDASEISLPKLFKIVETYFENKITNITVDGYQFKELINIAIETSPQKLSAILLKTQLDASLVSVLQEYVGLDTFSKHISNSLNSKGNTALIGLNSMFYLVTDTEDLDVIKTLYNEYWKHALYIIKHNKENLKPLKRLVVKTVNILVDTLGYNAQRIIDVFQDNNLILSQEIKNQLVAINTSFKTLIDFKEEDKSISILERYYQNNTLPELCYELCVNNRVPTWLHTIHGISPSKLMFEILEYYPLEFYKILKYQAISEQNYVNLHRQLKFEHLIHVLNNLNTGAHKNLDRVLGFYNALSTITIEGVSKTQLQYILFKIIIKSWQDQNWKTLEPVIIINKITFKLSTMLSCSIVSILKVFNAEKLHLPIAFQMAIEHVFEDDTKIVVSTNASIENMLTETLVKTAKIQKIPKSGIKVMNAGIVLINYYLPKLFDLLELIQEGEFKSKECQLDALHIVQYIVTGASFTNELLMPLNKVLCGLNINEPIYKGVLISKEHKNIIHDMINAIIGHWESIEGSSIDGFRGNWLVRDGLLFEHTDSWELKVEKRAYDLLLNQSPFSFSIIKYSWMDKPLHVKWTY